MGFRPSGTIITISGSGFRVGGSVPKRLPFDEPGNDSRAYAEESLQCEASNEHQLKFADQQRRRHEPSDASAEWSPRIGSTLFQLRGTRIGL